MGWATFWFIFSRTHLVTLAVHTTLPSLANDTVGHFLEKGETTKGHLYV
jgi:hypothetical protein